MEPHLHWPAIALRLVLTLIAGGMLGFERSKSGHAAGLRTTLLVTLAASISMIQMDLLIPTDGKPPNSYAVMDLMRLPLGILTGVGFIGAGAIVRKDELVRGLTTAATLWYATVIGLCLGGGQLSVGMTGAVMGVLILWGVRWFEKRLEKYQPAELRIAVLHDHFSVQDLRCRLEGAQCRIKSLSFADSKIDHRKDIECELFWPSANGNSKIPAMLAELEQVPGVIKLEWKGIGTGPS